MATKKRTKRRGKWMAKAFGKNKGLFSRKAARAGKSVQAYAREESNAPGKLGREARLARLGARISRRSAGRHRARRTAKRTARRTRRVSHR